MNKPVSIDDSSFDRMVLQAEKPVLVDFWATWCGPCRMIAPVVDELAEEYDGRINFVKVDVDQNPKTAARYNIMSIPTLLVFKSGEPVSHLVGVREKCDVGCGEDWSSPETLALAEQRIKDRFGDKIQLQYLDLSQTMPNHEALEWNEVIKNKNLSLPLLLINGQPRISGLFDIRQLLDTIEVEIEMGAQ